MNKQNNTIVIFEDLRGIYFFLSQLYVATGKSVRYFRSDEKLENAAHFKRLCSEGRYKKIVNLDFDLEKVYLPHKMALNMVDGVYDVLEKKSRLTKKAVKLLKSDKAHFIYIKELAERLYNYCFMILYLNSLTGPDMNKDVVFIPRQFARLNNLIRSAQHLVNLDKRIRVPFWSWSMSKAEEFAEKVKYVLGFPFWIMFKIKKITHSSKERKNYQLGIRIYESDFAFSYKYRSMDFLLEDGRLNKGNSLFCIEDPVTKEYLGQFKEKGYDFVEIQKILEGSDIDFLKRILSGTVSCWLTALAGLFSENTLITVTTLKILRDHLFWSRFLELYDVRNYVAYNNFDYRHMVRNILFEQSGTRTWYLPHTCNDTGIFAPRKYNGSLRDFAFSFLIYDSLATWGGKMTGYYSSHKNFINDYVNVGCIWSEHIGLSMVHDGSKTLKEKIKEKTGPSPKKIISVFDTFFGGHENLLTEEDVIAFFDGLIRLLDEDPDIILILKKKYMWSELKEIRPRASEIYRKIHEHPKCIVTAEEERDPADMIAVSDLVISMCYTSPTVEALGAGKKAIYFDGLGRLKGYYYDDFPNLTAHGYEELKNTVRYWLNAGSDAMKDHLDACIKGGVESFADGKAITRLREELLK